MYKQTNKQNFVCDHNNFSSNEKESTREVGEKKDIENDYLIYRYVTVQVQKE